MSLLPLFLQVRAATPNPPTSDAGSTTPPPADAVSAPAPDASTDAPVPTDAPATDAAATDTATPPASPPTSASPSSSGLQVTLDPSFYVAAGACYTGRGFGNSREDYHEGGCFQLTAGFPTIRFGENFYLRPEFRFQQEGVSHTIRPNRGDPITSSASASTLAGIVTLGWQPIQYFYAELGGLLGASYFESRAPESGEGGTFVSNLALGVSLHNWTATYGALLRLGIPEQRLMDGFALGGGLEGSVSHSDLSVVPDWVDRNPNDPPVAVSSTAVTLGAFLRVRFGGPSASPSTPTTSTSASPDAGTTSTADSSTTAPTPDAGDAASSPTPDASTDAATEGGTDASTDSAPRTDASAGDAGSRDGSRR